MWREEEKRLVRKKLSIFFINEAVVIETITQEETMYGFTNSFHAAIIPSRSRRKSEASSSPSESFPNHLEKFSDSFIMHFFNQFKERLIGNAKATPE